MNELATEEMESRKEPIRQEASGLWWAASAFRTSTDPGLSP
jgi:hypothetical protein